MLPNFPSQFHSVTKLVSFLPFFLASSECEDTFSRSRQRLFVQKLFLFRGVVGDRIVERNCSKENEITPIVQQRATIVPRYPWIFIVVIFRVLSTVGTVLKADRSLVVFHEIKPSSGLDRRRNENIGGLTLIVFDFLRIQPRPVCVYLIAPVGIYFRISDRQFWDPSCKTVSRNRCPDSSCNISQIDSRVFEFFPRTLIEMLQMLDCSPYIIRSAIHKWDFTLHEVNC